MRIKVGCTVRVNLHPDPLVGVVVSSDTLSHRDKFLLGCSPRFRKIYCVQIPDIGTLSCTSDHLEVIR